MAGNRAGKFVKQLTGYLAFEPAPLPPKPPVVLDGELARLVSLADQAIGRLDGVVTTLPNADLFVAMYVRQEAVLSSQIEGTQASLTDVLQFEADDDGPSEETQDVEEVVNYVAAMNLGLDRLETLPLSLRLLREIHTALMTGRRGGEKSPGEFRTSQNWIGPANCTLQTATFVPPPPHLVPQALGDLERFLHDDTLPVLVLVAFAHAQFETIHPFLDGNGRMGRLLMTFLLCQRRVLSRPLLYLSVYLKRNRTEYYDRLQIVRTTGDWEQWLKFFLRGVIETAEEATLTARKILALREKLLATLQRQGKSSGNLLRALDLLFQKPMVTVRMLERNLALNYPTANSVAKRLLELGILTEATGNKRNRRFLFQPYLKLFESSDAEAPQDALVSAAPSKAGD